MKLSRDGYLDCLQFPNRFDHVEMEQFDRRRLNNVRDTGSIPDTGSVFFFHFGVFALQTPSVRTLKLCFKPRNLLH